MNEIKIHSVGLRDGLQMEKTVVPFDKKLEWIDKLINSNIDIIQVGSFVHKEKVPQMADSDDLFIEINKKYPNRKVIFSGLVLNEKGLERAINCGVDMVCFGASASETHSQKNTRMSVNEAVDRIIKIAQDTIKDGKMCQVSVQSAFGCGFEGDIDENKVYSIVDKYLDAGIRLISLADTAGYANPEQVKRMYTNIKAKANDIELACHFHNTFGMGIANNYAAYLAGAKYYESAFGGLGGCPFTKKATGNVATADLIEMFQNFGLIKNINNKEIIELEQNVSDYFERELPGYVYKVGNIKH